MSRLSSVRHASRRLAILVCLFALTACGGTATTPAATGTAAPAGSSASTASAAAATASRAASASPTTNAAATVARASATRTAEGTRTVESTRTAESTRAASATPAAATASTPGAAGLPVLSTPVPTQIAPTPSTPPLVLPTATPFGAPTPTVPGPPVPVPPAPAAPVVTSTAAAQGGRGSTRIVSAAAPLRMYVAGDSFAEWLGADLGSFGRQSGVVSTATDGKISSGLANPAFFDWPARLTQALAANPPDVVVIILGANDLNGVSSSAGYFANGTQGWYAEYGRRQGEIMDLVGQRGAQLYWISQPPMRDPGQNAAAFAVNESAKAQIRSRPWVHYVDSWAVFGDANGNYVTAKSDGSGRTIIMRQDDGLHLSREGTTVLASVAYAQIRRDWQLP